MRSGRFFRIVIIFFCSLAATRAVAQETFTNPLLSSGADPWSIHKNGFYYYTNTLGDRIDIWKTENLADLKEAQRKTIWSPPSGTQYSKHIWAPEIHHLDNKWYVYFAADDGKNENHRMYVLENSAADPMQGEWVLKGKVSDPSDKWAIDGSVFVHHGKMYMAWSGWEGDVNGRQDIYIAPMSNPWTIGGNRVRLSVPEFGWERIGDLNEPDLRHVDVNEGPQFLIHGDRMFIVYSASGCWTDFYSLGMLTAAASANPLDPASWKKIDQPVFRQSQENDVWAPGHNSFFKSPDGSEDWILYHANDDPGQGCGRFRSPRAQKFSWDENNMPQFGVPVKTGTALTIPSENPKP